MRLIQIPFSHNCVKVRRALELKELPVELEDVPPSNRTAVRSVSGQGRVPVLVDGGRVIADSTAILRYLEESYPQRPLLPDDPGQHAECWVLEDWADAAFMELSRRMAYRAIFAEPGTLEAMFFPDDHGLRQRLKARVARRLVRRRFRIVDAHAARDEGEARRLADLAVRRLAGREFLLGDRVTVADVTLAAMSYPLAKSAPVRDDPAVSELLRWGRRILGSSLPQAG